MLIKRCNSTTFDIFWNTGWESWARFHREPDGALKHVNGKQMPTKLFQQVRAIINKRGKGRQVQEAAKELSILNRSSQNTNPVASPVTAVREEAKMIARYQK